MSPPTFTQYPVTEALTVNFLIASFAYIAKTVTISGVIIGILVGLVIYLSLGYPGFIILFLMFFLGSLATKFKYKEKQFLGIAEAQSGARGALNIVGKCLLGVLLSFLSVYYSHSYLHELIKIAYLGSFATALFDTVASELGPIYGKNRTFLLPSFKLVPVGTPGALSLPGTIFGVAGAAIISVIGILVKLVTCPKIIFVIILASFLANLWESIILAAQKKRNYIMKIFANIFNTGLGAIFSFCIAYLILT